MISLRAFLGLFPNTTEYEGKKDKLEAEFLALKAFEQSAELKRYKELHDYINSKEFADKKEEILSLRFKNTSDYQKEKEFLSMKNSIDIKLYYKTLDSNQLKSFFEIEKSEHLKKFNHLQEFVNSSEFAQVKAEASISPKKKFAKSDLAKKLDDFKTQSDSEKIKLYYRFINHKNYKEYINFRDSGIPEKLESFEKKINSPEFREKKQTLGKKEFLQTDEYQIYNEYTQIKSSKSYKHYSELAHSHLKNAFDALHGTPEIQSFEKLSFFIKSDDFKTQKKEIESYSFKDTTEFQKLQEFEHLKKSKEIRFYYQYLNSKDYTNYQKLHHSERVTHFEKAQEYIQSDTFLKNKEYCNLSPKRRWKESEPFQYLKEYEQLKDNEEIKKYFKGLKAKKFGWLRNWNETFFDDFKDSKLDTNKWITRYFYGQELLKESYSLAKDKHFVTEGKNLDFGNSILKIVTKREKIKGKSWDANHGFVPREFGYTSGLINTGKSFRQKYGTFEAKIKFHDSLEIQNAFWMVSKYIVPHINVAKANGKLVFGNAWADTNELKHIHEFSKKYKRSKFNQDFHIYTLEWHPDRLIWKINGVEVASTKQGIPHDPMYIALSAGLQKEVEIGLPAEMEIDWVRCFQHMDYNENS
jgi:beta-glucanase (GH16 family)